MFITRDLLRIIAQIATHANRLDIHIFKVLEGNCTMCECVNNDHFIELFWTKWDAGKE